ncbi:MAG: sigma-54-dependent transcriptional regulator [Pseudomonadota bacterium]
MSVSRPILFVDDDPVAASTLRRFGRTLPYPCEVFEDPCAALEAFSQGGAALVVTDLRMPGLDGFELLHRLKQIDPDVPVLVVTGHSSVDNAITAMKVGATDFIKKPFDLDEMALVIERVLEKVRLEQENALLKRALPDWRRQLGIVGQAPAMEPVFARIRKVADISCNVIISGESGTGKELVAQAIHYSGARRNAPFVVIDCGALSDTLLESELFGHEKGAFTGATTRKQGLLEAANGGTVFLDEICNISDAMQMKLLRVIQESRITRVGGLRSVAIDVRFIVATNRELAQMVQEGSFRHDLYHRLNVVDIRMPPLRERREDIPRLVAHFLEQANKQYGRQVPGFTSQAMAALMAAPWPGNIRELRNVVERGVILAEPGRPLDLADLPDFVPVQPGTGFVFEPPAKELVSLAEMESRYIAHVLQVVGGERKRAAEILGIDKTTLWRKLKGNADDNFTLNIQPSRF